MPSGFFLTGLLAATALAAPQASSTDVSKLKCDDQGDTSKAFEAYRVFAARERNYTGPHPQINVDVYMHVLLGSVDDATLTVIALSFPLFLNVAAAHTVLGSRISSIAKSTA